MREEVPSRVFRQYCERTAFLYLALSVLGLSTSVLDNVEALNMLSMSQASAREGASNEIFQALVGTGLPSRAAGA